MVKQNDKNYTIKELTVILQTADNVVRKKINKHRLTTSKKLINGKNTTVVSLSTEELEALKHELNYNKNKFSKKLLNNEQSISDKNIINKEQKDSNDNKDKLLDFMQGYIERLESTYKVLNEKDKQLYLLENLENRKDNEINRLIAENKVLNERLILAEKEKIELKQKINKKWWNINIM